MNLSSIKLFSNRNELLTYTEDVKDKEAQIVTPTPETSLIFMNDIFKFYFPLYSVTAVFKGLHLYHQMLFVIQT